MNLLFRFIWMWICARLAQRTDVMAEHRLDFRCMLTDIDFNMHMTNSRYHSFMDLSRVDMTMRSGAWPRVRQEGMLPALGSSSIRFRRAIRPLQKFTITCRMLSWDEKWIYMEHRFLAEGDVFAIAVVKAAFIDKNGRVPTERLVKVMGYDGSRPDFSAVLAKKSELDALLTAQ